MGAKVDSSAAALRAFAILEAVAGADRPVSMTDVVEAVRLPKPTVYRLLALLEEALLVQREPSSKRYSIGPRASRFALDALANSATRGARHAILQRLVDDIGETCNFTILDGAEVVYLDRVETAWPLRMNLQSGSRVPLHCSASGKLLLAHQPRAARDRLLERLPLERFTDNTITSRAVLERELARIRTAGCATDNEEYITGLACVAVPVRIARGRVAAAVAVHAPVSRLPLDEALKHLPDLERAADALAETLMADAATAAPGAPRSRRAATHSSP
jgi:DNA-binding IclR family transcriptional regulator